MCQIWLPRRSFNWNVHQYRALSSFCQRNFMTPMKWRHFVCGGAWCVWCETVTRESGRILSLSIFPTTSLLYSENKQVSSRLKTWNLRAFSTPARSPEPGGNIGTRHFETAPQEINANSQISSVFPFNLTYSTFIILNYERETWDGKPNTSTSRYRITNLFFIQIHDLCMSKKDSNNFRLASALGLQKETTIKSKSYAMVQPS